MKKSFRILLTLVLAVVMILSLTACISDCAAGMHQFVEVSAKEATCAQAGNIAYKKCTACGLCIDADGKQISANKVNIPAAHTYVDHPASSASCTEDGNAQYYTCENCDAIFDADKNPIDKLPEIEAAHTFGEWIDEVPATCVATGTKGHKDCSACNKHFDAEGNELESLEIAVNPSAHKFGELSNVIPATCTSTGTKAHKDCEYCKKHFDAEGNELESLEIAVNPSAHKFGELSNVIPATCTSTGTKAHKDCEYCNKHFDAEGNEITNLTIAKDPANHAETLAHHEKVDATCTEDGTKEYWSCSACSKNFSDATGTTEITELTIAALGHDYENHVAVSATCTEGGNDEYYTCKNCDVIFDANKAVIDKIPATAALGHDYGTVSYVWATDNSTCTATRTCSHDASHVETETATASATVTQQATCTLPELTTYVATFENSAFAEQTKADVETKSALGHDYGTVSYVWATDNSTCTATRTCSRDASHVETETVNSVPTVTQQSSCTTDELTTYVATFENSAFADQTKENIKTAEKGEHNYTEFVSYVTEPTCTDEGSATYKCAGCTATTEKKVDALGHQMTHHEADSATCTEEGTVEYYACSRCSNNFSDEAGATKLDSIVAAALGHQMTHHEADSATCTEEGTVEYYACSRCSNNFSDEAGATKLDSIVAAALGHDYENHVAVSATCTEGGNDEYYTCKNCDVIFDANKAVVDQIPTTAALGHNNLTPVSGTPATCESAGTLAHDKCACGALLIDGKVVAEADLVIAIDANAHSWNDGEITTAATCSAKGVKTYTCSHNSEHTKTQEVEIDPAAHKFGELSNVIPATCTSTGTKAHKDCEYCKKHFDAEGNEITDLTISALGHQMTHYDAKAATCTEDGNVQYWTCSVCKGTFSNEDGTTEIDKITVDKTGHNYGTLVAKVPATCVKNGTGEHFHCDGCDGYFKNDESKTLTTLEALTIPVDTTSGHNPATAWSTTEDGKHYHACLNTGCTAQFDLAEHDVEGQSWKTGDGNHWKECKTCGTEVGKTTHAAQGNWQDDGTDHWKLCECGAEVGKAAHSGVGKFDEIGHWTECSVCEITTVAKENHSVSGGKCTADGCPFIKATSTVTLTSIPDALEIATALSNNATTTESYFVFGRIKRIENATYGNVTIEDANGSSIIVYGLYTYDDVRYDKMTTKPDVGDVIVVYGPLTNYNGETPEIKNAIVVERNGGVLVTAQSILDEIVVEDTMSYDEYKLPITHKFGAITWTSSNTDIISVDKETGKATATPTTASDTTVTLTASITFNGETKTKAFAVSVPKDTGERKAILVAQNLSLSNATSVASEDGYTIADVNFKFEKGTNNNNLPKYYEDGKAIRAYAGNTITITVPSGKKIKKIEFTFSPKDGENNMIPNAETLKDNTWTGEAENVTFSIDGTSGHRRIASIAVTYYTPCAHESTTCQPIENDNESHNVVCSDCGKVTGTSVHNLTYSNNEGSRHTATCSDCGHSFTVDHTYINHECVCEKEEPKVDITIAKADTVTVVVKVGNAVITAGADGKYSIYPNSTVTIEVTPPTGQIATVQVGENELNLKDGKATLDVTNSNVMVTITLVAQAGEHTCNFSILADHTADEHTYKCSEIGCDKTSTNPHSYSYAECVSDSSKHTATCACGYSKDESHTYDEEEHQCVCGKEEPTVCIQIDNQTNGVVTVAMSADGQVAERDQYTYYVGTSVTLTITLTDTAKVATVKQGETEITLTNNAYTFTANADAKFVITVADKPTSETVTVDLTAGFNTYASGWDTSYGDRTVTSKDLGISDVSLNVNFTRANKQNSGMAIDNMPVVASQGSDQYVTISADYHSIKSATFDLQQWSTKKFAKLVLDYTTDGENWIAVAGVGQSGNSNNYFAAKLSTGDLPENVTAVRLVIYASGTNNVQIGIKGFTVVAE